MRLAHLAAIGQIAFGSLPSAATAADNDPHTYLKTQSGGTVVVRDFLRNGLAVHDQANPGMALFWLAQSAEQCDPKRGGQPCLGVIVHGFDVTYNVDTFTIALTTRSLAKDRLAAEAFLQKALGIPRSQMCDLKYILTTTNSVSSEFAGEDLKFSYCPGAARLP